MSHLLVDTSVWVAHFRRADPVLQTCLEQDQVLCHPWVILEIACGTPPSPREQTLRDLKSLKQAVVAGTDEILALIESRQLHNSGCGAVDMALLASALLTPEAQLWTADNKLGALASRLGIGFSPVRPQRR